MLGDVLARAGVLQGISPGDAAALTARFESVHAPKGTVVFDEDEHGGSDLYIVVSGKVKLSRRSIDGQKSLVLAVLGPADTFGALQVFAPGPGGETAAALTDTELARMPQPAVRSWLTSQPQTAMPLLRLLVRRLRHSSDTLASLLSLDAPGRLARLLLQLAEQFGADAGGGRLRVTHDLTRQDLAQLVSTSPETVHRTLAEFARHGWVRVDGTTVLILDREQLARRAS